MKQIPTQFLGSTAVVLGLILGAGIAPASADEAGTRPGLPDNAQPAPQPYLPDVAESRRPAVASDFPAHPAPGETVRLTSADGTTVYTVTAVTASCTVSMWANIPSLVLSPRRVTTRVGMSLSSGCDSKSYVGKLEWPGALGGWTQKAWNSGGPLYANQSGSISVTYSCGNTDWHTWRGSAWNVPAGVGSPVATSASAAIACG